MTIKSVRTVCPTCQKETECLFICEMFECQECKKDFAAYSKPCTFILESRIKHWKSFAEALIKAKESGNEAEWQKLTKDCKEG